MDPGFNSTGACQSSITFIDGDKGILRYRGYPIEQLAERSDFVETSWLLLYGELPTAEQLKAFRAQLTYHSMIHEDMKKFFEGFPPNAHPMAILSAMVASLSTYYPGTEDDRSDVNIVRLIAKVRTIAAYAYKKSIGQPTIYPRNDLSVLCQLSEHDVCRAGGGIQDQSGAGEGAEHAADPACGSRTELQHIDGADRGQQPSQHLRIDFRRHLCSVGAAARRSESGGAGNAADDSRRRRRLQEVRHEGQGQRQRFPTDGLWSPRLQEL